MVKGEDMTILKAKEGDKKAAEFIEEWNRNNLSKRFGGRDCPHFISSGFLATCKSSGSNVDEDVWEVRTPSHLDDLQEVLDAMSYTWYHNNVNDMLDKAYQILEAVASTKDEVTKLSYLKKYRTLESYYGMPYTACHNEEIFVGSFVEPAIKEMYGVEGCDTIQKRGRSRSRRKGQERKQSSFDKEALTQP